MSVFYSLLTSANRYTPRWHQEGIAVFLSTWLSGGYGRTLGSFDEMYFRSLVLDSLPFSTPEELESARRGHLVPAGHPRLPLRSALRGPPGGVPRYRPRPRLVSVLGARLRAELREPFGTSLDTAWADFISAETRFRSATSSP